jgi:hypothetical protein
MRDYLFLFLVRSVDRPSAIKSCSLCRNLRTSTETSYVRYVYKRPCSDTSFRTDDGAEKKTASP